MDEYKLAAMVAGAVFTGTGVIVANIIALYSMKKTDDRHYETMCHSMAKMNVLEREKLAIVSGERHAKTI